MNQGINRMGDAITLGSKDHKPIIDDYILATHIFRRAGKQKKYCTHNIVRIKHALVPAVNIVSIQKSLILACQYAPRTDTVNPELRPLGIGRHIAAQMLQCRFDGCILDRHGHGSTRVDLKPGRHHAVY